MSEPTRIVINVSPETTDPYLQQFGKYFGNPAIQPITVNLDNGKTITVPVVKTEGEVEMQTQHIVVEIVNGLYYIFTSDNRPAIYGKSVFEDNTSAFHLQRIHSP